jgi:hypothetical protein
LSGAAARLRADPGLDGDIVRLEHAACLKGMIVEDIPSRKKAGNLIAVTSREPSDWITAVVEECELHNPNPSNIGFEGPTGRSVVVFTRNPGRGSPPPPDSAANLSLVMRRSIVHGPAGATGVFAANFADRARITVSLSRNVIGGGLDMVGGVSRPDLVSYSEIIVHSDSNLYRCDQPADPGIGWRLEGASNPPSAALPAVSGSNHDTLVMDSTGDRVEGFDIGLYAVGGSRAVDVSGTVNDNRTQLTLTATQFASISADVVLIAAEAGVPSAGTSLTAPGDNNRLQLTLQDVKASGVRSGNVYADASARGGGALPFGATGSGNLLEIFGPIPFQPGPQPKVLAVKPLANLLPN